MENTDNQHGANCSWIKNVLPQSILGVLVKYKKPKIFQDLVTVQRSRKGPA